MRVSLINWIYVENYIYGGKWLYCIVVNNKNWKDLTCHIVDKIHKTLPVKLFWKLSSLFSLVILPVFVSSVFHSGLSSAVNGT